MSSDDSDTSSSEDYDSDHSESKDAEDEQSPEEQSAASLGAILGETVPKKLKSHRERISVIRGIRHHLEFANLDAIKQICAASGRNAVFTRARNARLIMSDIIPNIENDDVQPYCIWYPDVATEETYRQLASRYPSMRYHEELELLRDFSICEEARESKAEGSKVIYKRILSQLVRYAVMNDFERSVNEDDPKPGASLNGDAATLPCLRVTQDVGGHLGPQWKSHYFDITEDENVGLVFSGEWLVPKFPVDHAQLLYLPLPPALPTTNKDALILMAAYEGNVDRYIRLRRPMLVRDELQCIIRGIYHHTTFAKWWAMCDDRSRVSQNDQMSAIDTAIKAGFIMNNELSWMKSMTNSVTESYDNPFLIWWPLIPHEATLRELVRWRPDMKLQAALACIAGDYHVTYKLINPEPHHYLWEQAKVHCRNPF